MVTMNRSNLPQVFAPLLLYAGFYSGASAACTLEGEWRPHKTKTLAELYGSRITNDEKMKLAKDYRNMVVEYSGCNTMTTRIGSRESTRYFDTLEDTDEHVIIRYHENDEMARLTKDGQCFKTPVQGKAYFEHYCKS